MKIPEDYVEFLYLFKRETENFWENMSKSKIDNYENTDWIIGAKWIGLEDSDIEEIESKYNISFTIEHKEFLKILHTIDKKRPVEYYDDNGQIFVKEKSYFYNWLLDDDEIDYRFTWPYKQILTDVKKGFWLKSWGKRPELVFEVEKIFSDWYNKAPKLIPIHSHRFIVNLLKEERSPVLSVWGSDTIVYGWSIKHYLLNELDKYLDVFEKIYSKEDKQWYFEPTKEFQLLKNKERLNGEEKGIPFWYELIQ